MEEIIIQNKITQKDYIRFAFVNTYRKPSIIVISALSTAMVITSILYFLGIFKYFSEPPYFELIFGLYFTLFFPIYLWIQSIRTFKTMGRLHESITYHFREENIQIVGESFNSQYSWDKIFKIKDLKNWVLIYQSKNTANILLKKSFGVSFPDFRTMVQNHSEVKSKFRKDNK
ncbi:MAG: YcxB family protein [Bacteroidota bacterium]|nr:YcxB family protein [Bacteroidota bacterium]MDP4204738.1 YcxB family protein [Bacteroidota bacterium]